MALAHLSVQDPGFLLQGHFFKDDCSEAIFGQDMGLVSLYDQVLHLLTGQPTLAIIVAELAGGIHPEGAHGSAKPDVLACALDGSDLCPRQFLVGFAFFLRPQIIGEVAVCSPDHQLVLGLVNRQ